MDSPTSPLPSDPSTLPSHGLLACLLCMLPFAPLGAVFWTRARQSSLAATATAAVTGTATVVAWAPYQYGRWTTTMWWSIHIPHLILIRTILSEAATFAVAFYTWLWVWLAVWFYVKMVIALLVPLWDRKMVERKAKEQLGQQLKSTSANNNSHYGSISSTSSTHLSFLTITDAASTAPVTSAVENNASQGWNFLRSANFGLAFLAIYHIVILAATYFDDDTGKSLDELIRIQITGYFTEVLALLISLTLTVALEQTSVVAASASASFKTKSRHWFTYGKLLMSIAFQLALVRVAFRLLREDSNSAQIWKYWSATSGLAFLSIVLLTGDLEKEFSLTDLDSSVVV